MVMKGPPGTIKIFSALLKFNNLTGAVKFPINVEIWVLGVLDLGMMDG